MAANEQLTVTLPADLASTIRAAVAAGDYRSSSDVVRDALRGWARNRETKARDFAALKADIDLGFADVAAGRVVDIDIDRIVALGRQGLIRRSA
ncbi:MAG: ribbon-helix-helix protein, CopG family [Acetobacteraceae bacterium]|nr:ribbon-helix-helix protein, CopG family [Acetobacteraceae bacterium]